MTLEDIPDITTPFRPSLHGLPFGNGWVDHHFAAVLHGVGLELVTRGRCGGMAFSALDYFEHDRHAPGPGELCPEGALPASDSPIARYVWKRQVESLLPGTASNLRRFVSLTRAQAPRDPGRHAAELSRALAQLAEGRPVPLGLVGADRVRDIGLDHQVVAWAARGDEDTVTLWVYDSNHPGRDDVTLATPRAGSGPIEESVGGRPFTSWRALFVERYAPDLPPEA